MIVGGAGGGRVGGENLYLERCTLTFSLKYVITSSKHLVMLA